ncbi:MAG: hypothetical protein ABI759_15495 [Candidatus Solibacter sp.]
MTQKAETQSHVAPRVQRFLLLAFAAGLVLGGAAVWQFARSAPPRELRYTPITFDPGVTTTPALSPDGNLLVYATDRDGGRNLDLYVQPLRGGDPARLTWTPEDESDPSFSSDGTAIAYSSTRNEGGIYLIPALGGTPRLLAAEGHNPRFSPRENLIAYWTGAPGALLDSGAKTYVAPLDGGTPRQIRADFSAVQRPVWSPDGQRLIVWAVAPGDGLPADRADFWITSLEHDRAERVELAGPVARAGGSLTLIDDMLWTDQGLVFSMRIGWVRNIFRCRLTPGGKVQGELVRLAGGIASAEFPTLARDGQMVFASGTQRFDVWGLQLDANRGVTHGTPYRITDSTAPAEHPAVSPDGTRALYATPRNGTSQVWLKDLAKGEEHVVASGPNASYPVWLRNGAGIAFTQKLARRSDVYLLDLASGAAKKVYEGGHFWDLNSTATLALAVAADTTSKDLLLVDLATGKASVLARPAPGASLEQATYSPDDSWVTFAETASQGNSQIYLIHPRGSSEISRSDWIPLMDSRHWVNCPRFSPDGKVLYFTLDQAGKRSIQAVPVDTISGKPQAQPLTVFESSLPAFGLSGVNPRSLNIGVARDKIILLMRQSLSNLWRTTPLP